MSSGLAVLLEDAAIGQRLVDAYKFRQNLAVFRDNSPLDLEGLKVVAEGSKEALRLFPVVYAYARTDGFSAET